MSDASDPFDTTREVGDDITVRESHYGVQISVDAVVGRSSVRINADDVEAVIEALEACDV